MFRSLIILVLPVLMVGCTHRGKPPLPRAVGAYRPLNPGHWTPARADLRGPRVPLAPAASPNIPAESAR